MFRPIRPGVLSTADAQEINRALAQLARVLREPVLSDDLAVTQARGMTVARERFTGLWAKVTGAPAGGAHPWVEQEETAPGTFTDLPGGLEGTTTRGGAYHPNGATVAVNTRVWLDRAPTGDHWLIKAAAAAGGYAVRANSTGAGIVRPRLNLIAGAGMAITVAEDTTDDEVDALLSASAPAPAFSGAGVTNSVATSGISTSGTVLPWNTERFDTDNYHDPGFNTRLRIPSAGYYRVSAAVTLDEINPSGAGNTDMSSVEVVLRLNGTTFIATDRLDLNTRPNPGALLRYTGKPFRERIFAASDYVEVVAFHTGGTSVQATSGLPSITEGLEFNITRLGLL
jgi:hypothetical protein